jgi:hypothetical protein
MARRRPTWDFNLERMAACSAAGVTSSGGTAWARGGMLFMVFALLDALGVFPYAMMVEAKTVSLL